MLHVKFEIHGCSGLRKWYLIQAILKKMLNLLVFATLSISSHLQFSTRLNSTILKPWSLIMLLVKFEIHGYSDLRE